MEINLLRHGESVGNASGIIQGQINVDLTEEGYKQASLAAERLKNENFDYIISSDLRRAKNTAREVIKFHSDMELILDSRLRERDHGEYDGMLKSRVDKDLIKRNKEDTHFAFPGGESSYDLLKRVKEFHDEIFSDDKYKDKKILIVAHSTVIKTFLALLNQKDEVKAMEEISLWEVSNTALYKIDAKNPTSPEFLVKNCVSHLE